MLISLKSTSSLFKFRSSLPLLQKKSYCLNQDWQNYWVVLGDVSFVGFYSVPGGDSAKKVIT
ncbi:MAG: hypothetical protein ACK5WF_17660, partial [Cyclobacteriaceae bacterium]